MLFSYQIIKVFIYHLTLSQLLSLRWIQSDILIHKTPTTNLSTDIFSNWLLVSFPAKKNVFVCKLTRCCEMVKPSQIIFFFDSCKIRNKIYMEVFFQMLPIFFFFFSFFFSFFFFLHALIFSLWGAPVVFVVVIVVVYFSPPLPLLSPAHWSGLFSYQTSFHAWKSFPSLSKIQCIKHVFYVHLLISGSILPSQFVWKKPSASY